MRSVLETPRKPAWVFNATAHSTECTSTNTKLPSPRPNQISASGSSAIAGSGLSMAVIDSRKSVPIRVVIASTVRMNASTTPVVNPIASTCSEARIRSGSTPLRMPSHQACDRIGQRRHQQLIVEMPGVTFPKQREQDQQAGLAHPARGCTAAQRP